MNVIRLFLVTITAMLLVACGGGGSSSDSTGDSDGGTGSGSDPMPNANDLSGMYTGTQNLVLSLAGTSQTTNIDANVTVTGNNILIDPLTANGSVANNTFVATSNRTSTQAGLTCQFLLTYNGSIIQASLTGTITGTAVCNQDGTNQTLDVTGTISADRG